MTKEEYLATIESIIDSDVGFGFSVFACLKNGMEYTYCDFLLEDKDTQSFKDAVRDKIHGCLIEKYLYEDIGVKQIIDIHDNTNSLYEIVQDENYSPFSFLGNKRQSAFSNDDKPNLIGLAFKFNKNNAHFYAYQQIYPVTIPQKKNGTFVYAGSNNIYREFNKELLRIDYRIDLLVIGASIFTFNINLLQSKFGFETFIRNESQKTIDIISSLDIIESMDIIIAFEGKEKLTNAKKLMKIKKSPVLQMHKAVLIDKLKTIPRYKGKLKIENDKIQISTNKDVNELLKILNDDYLISELTEKPYESSDKILEEAV